MKSFSQIHHYGRKSHTYSREYQSDNLRRLPLACFRRPLRAMSASDGSGTTASLSLSLFPVPNPPLPPRVEHIIVAKQEIGAAAIISQELLISHEYATQLMHFGAVYFCPQCPPLPPHLAHLQPSTPSFEKLNPEDDAELRTVFKKKTPQNKKIKPERILEDREVKPGAYLRVHVHPKRFPRVYDVDWKARVIAEGPEWVVIDKPSGVTVGPTVDNLRESCVACAAGALGESCSPVAAVRLQTSPLPATLCTALRTALSTALGIALSTA
ncbi:hypothetical protein CYMTET_45918, partial [Cymbomonas tetramitiformis]